MSALALGKTPAKKSAAIAAAIDRDEAIVGVCLQMGLGILNHSTRFKSGNIRGLHLPEGRADRPRGLFADNQGRR